MLVVANESCMIAISNTKKRNEHTVEKNESDDPQHENFELMVNAHRFYLLHLKWPVFGWLRPSGCCEMGCKSMWVHPKHCFDFTICS